jgi:hypothetical protein
MNAKLSYNFQNFKAYIFPLTIALRFAHLKSQTKLNIVIVIAPNCPNLNKVLRQLTKLTNPFNVCRSQFSRTEETNSESEKYIFQHSDMEEQDFSSDT